MRTIKTEENSKIDESRMGKLPLLTVIVYGGKVLFYNEADIRELANVSIEADNVPGWIYRAMVLNHSNMHSQLRKTIDARDLENSIRMLLSYIADGNPAILNVNSEKNYAAADLIWFRPQSGV